MPRVLWFIFNLRIKNRVNYLHDPLHLLHTGIIFFWSILENLYILKQLSAVITAAHESIHASISKQTESHLSTTWPGTLWIASHANDLACLFSAWLASFLLQIKVPNSRTYKSHLYTSHAKTTYIQHSNSTQKHTFTYFTFSWVSWRVWLCRHRLVLYGYPKNFKIILVGNWLVAFLEIHQRSMSSV